VKAADVKSYWSKGWLVLRALFTPEEVASWRAECDRLLSLDLIDQDNLRTGFRKIDGQPMIERIDPVIDVSPTFNALVNDDRILEPLRAIFNDTPHLFKDKLIVKLPTMSGYTMHQDQAWWQMCAADDILSVSIAIDPATTENGCIELFPGYHGKLLTPPGELRNLTPEEVAEHIDLSTGGPIVAAPGDVVVFHSQTPHQSGVNNSPISRRNLYLTYTAARSGNLYAAHRDHYKTYVTAKMSDEEKARKYFK
jgi:ectoine hydroxylase-related dioxygenase (phytanoyl-CoA dioxygenase family)